MNDNLLKISRSNLQLMKECPRCFWLSKNKGINRPQGYPYTLSIAVDILLKQEFDGYRDLGMLPPVLTEYGLKDAKLFEDTAKLAMWRNNFQGLRFYDKDLNIIMFGAVDDILQFNDGRLAVIDYKSSGAKEVSVYEDYQTQMDVYTYILERLGETTARKAYFVFYQVDKTQGFQGRLPFNGIIKEVDTKPDYVHELFKKAVGIARSDIPPASNPECQYCNWASGLHTHSSKQDIKTI